MSPDRKKIPNRLKWRFFTQFTAGALVTMLLIGSLIFYYIQKETSSAFKENSRTVVERYELRLHDFFQNEMEKLLLYHRLLGRDSLQEVISDLSHDSKYLHSYILDDQGMVLYACETLTVGYNYAGTEAYQKALRSREPFTLARFHHTERRLAIDMIIPVYGETGDLAYVAVHQLNPAWLEERLASKYYDGEGDILMFNEEGIIFLSINNHSLFAESPAPARMPSLMDYGFFLSHLQDLGEVPRYFSDEDYLVTYKRMEGEFGVIANRISLAIIGDHYRRILPMMALGMGLGLLFFAILGIILAKRTMKPIHDLSRQVEETLQGKRKAVEGGAASELTVLVDAFNQSWQENLQAQQEFERLANDYEKVFNGTQDAMFLVEVTQQGEFRFLRNNLSHQQLTGISLAEIQGKTPRELLDPAPGEQVEKNYQNCVEKRTPLFYEEILDLPAGRRTCATNLTPVFRGKEVHYLVGSSKDITEQKEAEEALRLSEERYRLLVENAAEGIGVLQDDIMKYVNPMILELLDYAGELVTATPFLNFVHPDDRKSVGEKLQNILDGQNKPEQFSARIIAKNNEVKWVEITGVEIKWEDRPAVLGFMNDITERKRNQEKLEYLSLHDALTGLYNRAFFDEEMKRLTGSREYPVTVISADLDGLKLINDTLGHALGDELIRACAGILQNSLRTSDILARIGGDEFAVLLPRTDNSTGTMITGRIRSQTELHNAEHPELPLSISVGTATADEGNVSLEETYKKADDFMYRDKLARRDIARSQAVDILLNALVKQDFTAGEHSQKVSGVCLELGERLGLPEKQLIELALLAQVHKLGMVGVPDSIILKNGPLTADEREMVNQHPEKGYRIALSSPDLADIADLILKQKAWWDGSGNPQGLGGEEIPIQCRILAIADAYTAMTSDRPYRKAKSDVEARQELQRCAGTQFDPALVGAFISSSQSQDQHQ